MKVKREDVHSVRLRSTDLEHSEMGRNGHNKKDHVDNEHAQSTSCEQGYYENGIIPSEKQILVVEDEKLLRDLLFKTLNRVGYQVITVADGEAALELVGQEEIDLILLDIMMPKMDGFVFCEEIRKSSDVPIMMLTALNRPDDVVRGLQMGADEYVTKPFNFNELSMRIHSLLRRTSWLNGAAPLAFSVGDGPYLDDKTEVAHVKGQEVQLTPMEYRFLRYLMTHPDRPISNEKLLKEVWNYSQETNTSIIQSIVRRIRLKIEEDPSEPAYVISVWGVGYKFQTI